MANPFNIVLNFDFPDGDPKKQPRVTNSTSEVDTVGATYDSIEWTVRANITDIDGLHITGIRLFSDAAKRNPATPAVLSLPGGNVNTSDWKIAFDPRVSLASQATYYYDVDFADDDYAGLEWDPTLKIQPRTASENPPQGAQGAAG